MGLPEPASPNPESTNDGRADWLCGPDEGLEAEISRTSEGAAPLAPARLTRPGADAPPPPPAPRNLRAGASGTPSFVPTAPPARPPGVAPVNVPQAWSGAASSVPRLRDDAEGAPRAQGIDTSRVDFPLEEIAERSPSPAYAPAPVEFVERPKVATALPSEFVAPIYKPWWQEALDQLRTNRIWQISAVGLALIPVLLLLAPRGPKQISIRDVKARARELDGQVMSVSGRVGEVFATGAGYTFYLVQGRDTIVVFTRARVPSPRQKLKLSGTLSTGFLDGQARLALFEDAQ